MKTLILQATPTAQWYTLLGDAEHACSTYLKPDLESYMVLLLMRFLKQPELVGKALGFEFLEALQAKKGQREDLLQSVGDSCLLYSGFFPEQAGRRRVKVSYFVEVGRSAYLTLAEQGHRNLSELFSSLSQSFVAVMDILQTMRELSGNTLGLTPIEAEELWSDTGSQYARIVLKRYIVRP